MKKILCLGLFVLLPLGCAKDKPKKSENTSAEQTAKGKVLLAVKDLTDDKALRAKGNEASFEIAVERGTYTGEIKLALSVEPANTALTFTPTTPTIPPGQNKVAVQVKPGTSIQLYTVKIMATGADLTPAEAIMKIQVKPSID